MAAGVTVVLDYPAIASFRGWNGELGRSFGRLERETVWRQRALANKRTGNLVKSISSTRTTLANGNLQFNAGSAVGYALFVDQGTKPHTIRAKNAPALVFFWPKVGRVVAFKSVQHPGTRKYDFLTRGLQGAMLMWQRGG